MQRQRVADSKRPRVVCGHAPGHNLHPVAATDLGQKAVEIEEPLETSSRRFMLIIYQTLITRAEPPCRQVGTEVQFVENKIIDT